VRGGVEKVGIEFSPFEPTSLWWIWLEWVSSTRKMSTGLAALNGSACVGIKSRSSFGVARLLDGDPDCGTSSSMKSNAAPSVGARSAVFPTTTRQYSSISSLLRSASDRSTTAESVQCLVLIEVEDEDDGIRSMEKCRRKGWKAFMSGSIPWSCERWR
jgi:hypothetical protein